MLNDTDIEKLAELARIDISPDEKKQFVIEIASILGYVGDIQKAATGMDLKPTVGSVYNIVRQDEVIISDPRPLIEEFPHREGDFLTVKKILS